MNTYKLKGKDVKVRALNFRDATFQIAKRHLEIDGREVSFAHVVHGREAFVDLVISGGQPGPSFFLQFTIEKLA